MADNLPDIEGGAGRHVEATPVIIVGADGVAASSSNPTNVATRDGFFTVSAAFNRPADANAYAAGDRVANATSGAAVLEFTGVARATGEAVRIERTRLRKSGPTLTNAQFRIHLFRTLPTVSVGDNGAFNASNVLALSDVAGYVGTIDITMDKAAAAGARGVGAPGVGSGITCEAAGATDHETSLWAVVEALAAYVPASGETFTITLEAARS